MIATIKNRFMSIFFGQWSLEVSRWPITLPHGEIIQAGTFYEQRWHGSGWQYRKINDDAQQDASWWHAIR